MIGYLGIFLITVFVLVGVIDEHYNPRPSAKIPISGFCKPAPQRKGRKETQSFMRWYVSGSMHEYTMILIMTANLFESYATVFGWWQQSWFHSFYEQMPYSTLIWAGQKPVPDNQGNHNWFPQKYPGLFTGDSIIRNPCALQSIQFNWNIIWMVYWTEYFCVLSGLGWNVYMNHGWGYIDIAVIFARSVEFMLKALQEDCSNNYAYKHIFGINIFMTTEDFKGVSFI